jgi:hypothetical protein
MMRSIYVENDLTVRFPGREEEFDQGVEMGIAIALMATGQNFTTLLSSDNIEQAEAVAAKMNFHLMLVAIRGESRQVAFRRGRPPMSPQAGREEIRLTRPTRRASGA